MINAHRTSRLLALAATLGGCVYAVPTSPPSSAPTTQPAVAQPPGPVAIAAGTKGTLAKTADGGRTWTVLTPEVIAGDDLLDVAFLDARTGWALGKQALYLTADGGKSWVVSASFDHQLVDFALPDATHGYAVGPAGQIWTVTAN